MSAAPERFSSSPGGEEGFARPSADIPMHPRFAAALEALRAGKREAAEAGASPAARLESAPSSSAPVPPSSESAGPASAAPATAPPPGAPAIAAASEVPVRLGWDHAAQWERAFEEDRLAESGAREEEGSSTGLILFGLLVVWGVLYVLAHAQNISSTDVSFSWGDASISGRAPAGGAEPRGIVSVLDARQKAMLVGGIFFHDLSKREMLRLTMQRTGVRVAEADLALLPDERRTIDLDDKPVYELLHSIIDDSNLGFGLRAKELTLFRQRIQNTEPGVGRLRQFDWEAVVPLREEPTLVFPSPRSDVWASFSIVASSPGSPESARVAVEIWRGGRPLALGEGNLGPDGKAQLNFTAGGTLLVTVEAAPADASPAAESSADAPHKLRIYYEAASAG